MTNREAYNRYIRERVEEQLAYGDSAVDEKVMKNLKTLIDVTNWCLDGIKRSSESLYRPEESMREIGVTAMSALFESADWTREIKEGM